MLSAVSLKDFPQLASLLFASTQYLHMQPKAEWDIGRTHVVDSTLEYVTNATLPDMSARLRETVSAEKGKSEAAMYSIARSTHDYRQCPMDRSSATTYNLLSRPDHPLWPGQSASGQMCGRASQICETCTISRPSVTSTGRSLTSFLFCCGRMTFLTPAVSAPINFCLMPPTGMTLPRSENSPVMAMVGGTVLPLNRLIKATVWAIPADGPSFGTAPDGQCTWIERAFIMSSFGSWVKASS